MSTIADVHRTGISVHEPGTASEEMARFVVGLTMADVPAAVRSVARVHLLDGLGIALASSAMDFAETVHEAATQLGAGDDAHVIGFGTGLPAASAALVNGTLVHGLDFDDTHIEAIYHATAPALAAALAVGEAENADGESVLLAFIAGLEVGCRIAGAAAGRFHDRGFHPTGIAGTFAAACVAAKLRRQSAPELASALGICASQAAGTLELGQSSLKRLHPGWAAHSGIIASHLAGAGFVGPLTIFEGANGLYGSHLGDAGAAAGLNVHDLGSRWMATDIAVKPYPCCHFTHAFIDAALEIVEGVGTLRPSDVHRIVCPTSERVMALVTEPTAVRQAPQTVYQAQFSVQYAVAYALVHGRVDVATFYDDRLDDPEVLAMAAKVSCPRDPASDYPRHFPGEVIVHLHDGATHGRRVPASSGTPDNPLAVDAIVAKFRANAARTLPAGTVETLVELVDDLEAVPDIGAILRACTTDE